MSIFRSEGSIGFACDWKSGCSEELYTEERDWTEALKQFKDEGWLSLPVTGGFKHLCPYHKTKREQMAMSLVETLLDQKF